MTKRRIVSVLCIGNDPVNLNLRCPLLKQQGRRVLSSGGHEGILRFSQEVVNAVAVDLNDDGSEAARIIAEWKRLRPGSARDFDERRECARARTTKQASAVVLKSQEVVNLVRALNAVMPPRSKSKS